MSLIKWEPFDDLDRVFSDIASLPELKMSPMGFDLAVDVYEDGNTLIAEVNLPGLDGSNIAVEVEDTLLRLSGKREEVQEKKEKNHYSKEIRRGTFERLIPLPALIQQEKVTAEYKHGVLKVVMPLKEESGEKRIKVTVT
jgi:HSP20 family protein